MKKRALSKYLSYLLRHHPQGLTLSKEGFVEISEVLTKLQKKFPEVTKADLEKLTQQENKRFEIKDNNIRALYGHSIPIEINLKPVHNSIKKLYHGTTKDAALTILQQGLKPKGRQKVHLSATKEEAARVGKRRTKNPVILEVNVEKAKEKGVTINRATKKVYVADFVPPSCIRKIRDPY